MNTEPARRTNFAAAASLEAAKGTDASAAPTKTSAPTKTGGATSFLPESTERTAWMRTSVIAQAPSATRSRAFPGSAMGAFSASGVRTIRSASPYSSRQSPSATAMRPAAAIGRIVGSSRRYEPTA